MTRLQRWTGLPKRPSFPDKWPFIDAAASRAQRKPAGKRLSQRDADGEKKTRHRPVFFLCPPFPYSAAGASWLARLAAPCHPFA